MQCSTVQYSIVQYICFTCSAYALHWMEYMTQYLTLVDEVMCKVGEGRVGWAGVG